MLETHGTATAQDVEVPLLSSGDRGSLPAVLGCGETGVANCAGLEATGL